MVGDDVVGRMARAIYESDNCVFGSPAFERLDDGIRQAYARAARAALSALGPEYVLVPREPTDAMLIAGAARLRDFYSEAAPFCRTKAMYRAMLATAIEKEPDSDV